MASKKKVQSTLKSADTEEWLDVVFTRPIGYRWAVFFNHFDIHPNTVTVISMVLGAMSALFFCHRADTPRGLVLNIVGVALLMIANFYDSADGQLARMTGKTTRLGRILDGAAGDVWFICIYVALAFRMFGQPIPFTGGTDWGLWAFVLCAVAGLFCHGTQSGLADYYRQVHLYFLKGQKGSELDNYRQQKELYDQTAWKGNLLWKGFLFFYVRYTKKQESQTPQFQRLMSLLRRKYDGDIPQDFRDAFRAKSLPLMKWTNILTFNTRAIVLYVSCLADQPCLYPLFEITVMSVIYIHMRLTHERMSKNFTEDVEKGSR